MRNPTVSLGLDIGSTTVKAVVLRDSDIVFSDYRRHHADVRGELRQLLDDVRRVFPEVDLTVGVTGSEAITIATFTSTAPVVTAATSPSGAVPDATADRFSVPAVASASVTLAATVQVTLAPGASEAAPSPHTTGSTVPVPSRARTVAPTSVRVTFPVFVATKE